AGGFADLWYVPSIQQHPDAELAAVCSQSGERAEQMAVKYGIPEAYTSYEKLLESEGLDGICIVTPNVVHAPIAEAAARKGIHVLCEKPLAMSSAEAKQMWNTADEAGIVH